MRNLFCFLFFFCYYQSALAQPSYKDSIKSYLTQKKKAGKYYNDKDEDGKRSYYYQKSSEQIITTIINPKASHQSYIYNYRNGKLIMMQLYLPYEMMPESRGKKMYGRYYFRDGELVDNDLMNFPEVDVSFYYQIGIELYKRGVKFLKEKGKVVIDY